MNLLKINLFQRGAFKQLKFLASEPQDATQAIIWTNTRNITKEVLKPDANWLVPMGDADKCWMPMRALEYKLKVDGKLVQEEPVLLLTERQYYPFDPYNRINPEDIEEMMPLSDVARLKVKLILAKLSKYDAITNTITLAIYTGTILGGLMMLITMVRGCG